MLRAIRRSAEQDKRLVARFRLAGEKLGTRCESQRQRNARQLTLFADLSRPQIEQSRTSDEGRTRSAASCAGFTGTGFYVVLDGEVEVKIEARSALGGQGRFLRRDVIRLARPPGRNVVTQDPLCTWVGPSGRDSCSNPAVMTGCSRAWRCASTTRAGRARSPGRPVTQQMERPFPPGDYPVVVVGSGPGGLQTSYFLRRLGIDHAVISADPSPGGMFRRFPFFQRLLSWTKPYAPVPRDDRFYQWFDWNSLLADEPEARAIMPISWTASSFPRDRDEANSRRSSSAGFRCATTARGPRADGEVRAQSRTHYRPVAIFAVASPIPTCLNARVLSTSRTTGTRARRRRRRQAALLVARRLRVRLAPGCSVGAADHPVSPPRH